MGRKIAAQLLALTMVLTALYWQQDIFAQDRSASEILYGPENPDEFKNPDEPEDLEDSENPDESKDPEEPDESKDPEEPEQPEEPLVPYKLEYEQPDGENSYYRTPPTVKITHPGKRGETVYVFQSGDEIREGRLEKEEDSVTIQPEEFQEGTNVLEVWMEDDKKWSQYQKIEFKVDTRAPGMQADLPEGIWHKKQISVGVKTDDHAGGSGVKYIVCYVNGKQRGSVEGESASFCISELSYGGQEVSIRITAVDYAGNLAVWEDGVLIDGAPPTARIEGVTDYMVTGQDVEAVFTAADENILKTADVRIVRTDPDGRETLCQNGSWTGNSANRTLRQNLTEDGKYQMELKAEDMAGYATAAKAQVIIDKEGPAISLVDELEEARMREFVWEHPVEEFISDFTSFSYALTVDGQFYFPGQSLKKEGRHQLKIEAVDQAGNRSEARADFVIDRTAPEIRIDGIKDGKAYEERAKADISVDSGDGWITEIKINGTKQKLPEKCRKYSVDFEEYKFYEIEVLAEDEAGNKSEKTAVIEVTAKKTTVDKLLHPVKAAFGIEETGFEKDKDVVSEAGDQDKPSANPIIFVLPAGVLAGAAGIWRLLMKRK